MTKQELINTIAERAEINKIDVEHAINTAFNVAKEAIAMVDSIFTSWFWNPFPKATTSESCTEYHGRNFGCGSRNNCSAFQALQGFQGASK